MKPSPAIKAAALAALFSLAACDAEVSVVQMRRAPGPAGAAMLTLDAVKLGDTSTLVAPTPQKLMVGDTRRWQGVDAQLLPSFQVAPFESLRKALGESPFPRSRSFCAANGQVWFLARPTPQDSAQLWLSLDAGRTFSSIELPQDRATSAPEAPIRATEPFWVRCAGDQVFLLHSSAIWRYVGGERTWSPISLTGVDFETQGLPPVVRSYLPRSAQRGFELLTLLGDQLYVWRRDEPDGTWLLTSTFPGADRDLLGHEKSNTIWMVTADAIHQSDDHGEQWFRVTPPELHRLETVQVFDIEGATVTLAGTSDGAIWRGDGGWTEVRAPDPDGRPVAGLALTGDTIWAAITGLGALASRDLGASWQLAREGDAFASIQAVAFAPNTLVVATSSGTYERSLDGAGDWQMLTDRASTAVHVNQSGRIVIGTRAGDVLSSNEPAAVAREIDAPLFEFAPSQAYMPTTAVVGIESTGDYVFAFTHRAGVAVSSDGGDNWQPYDISPALVSTLSSSTVTHVLVGEGTETLYLAEKSDRRGTPTQLWRSSDSGATWTAVEALQRPDEDGPVAIEWASPGQPPLLAARNNVVSRSMDGDHWEVLDGPWRTTRIVGMDVSAGHGAILAETGARHILFYLESLDDPKAVERIAVSWPPSEGIGEVRAVYLNRRRLYVVTQDALFEGALPIGTSNGGLASTLTAILVVVATSVGFGIIKRFAR